MKFYRLKEVPFLYPVVSFELTSVTVQAQSRRLRVQWTPQLAQDMQYMMATDCARELEEVITEEFQPRRSIASRYATHMVNNRYYGVIRVTGDEKKNSLV